MTHFKNLSDDEFSRQVQRAIQALPDAPVHLQRAAIGLWPAPSAAAALKTAAQAVLTQIAAVLSFDSWARPALAHGMRSLPAPTRHLLYSAQGRDIDLRIAPAAEAYSLSGQILGPDEAGMIEFTSQGAGAGMAHVTHLDALGEFRIDGVRRGTYVMTLRMGGDNIVLPPVVVGEQPN